MTKNTLIISALLFLPAVSAMPQTTPQPVVEPTSIPVPFIEFEEEIHDAGDIWEGEKASHTFSFKNTGDAVLLIKKVKTSCGCTAAVISSKEIESGKTGEIKATFNTKRFRGKQSKTIYVSSNDPKHPTVQLKLQATVKSAASFKPRNIQFGEVTRGEKISRIIELTPEVETIKITELTAAPDVFTARILEAEKVNPDEKIDDSKNRPIRIEVSVSPDAPIGRHNGNLTVKIDHPRISTLSARLYLRVVGQVKFSPRMLFFDENAQKNRGAKKIRITGSKGPDLEIVGVNSTSPQFQAETVIIKAGKEFDVEIRMAENVEPGRYQGEIVIKTNDPDQKEIKIPVRSNIRKK
jgi:Protein of unknown function (DUF1573)